ncbi:MAG: toxic anion resistance protein [Selenomonadaceae bacterium]|nr:toxic anion resistance protein [Selenomonadaceae bacterium]MBR1579353.1 toxic anion resistance protein [Selenomonadaceae bacterium]
MAEINLEDLMAAKGSSSTESQAVTAVVPEQEIEKITRQVEALTPEEKRRVEEIKNSIDMRESSMALTYGVPAQREIAAFSDSILSSVRTKDSGQVGELLNDLVGKVRAFDTSEKKSFLQRLPFFGSMMNKAEEIKDGYEKLSTQVERIEMGLEKAKVQMLEDVAMFDGLFEKNLTYFKELQLYIRAGEEKVQEMRDVTLPKLKAQAAQSDNPMAVQVVADFEESVNRFEKKVHDLKISRTLAIQTAPQIRLIQNNDKVLIERVQTAIYHTIPLWKNQMVIALGLSRQNDVLALQRAVNDTTNDLLRRNAEMLKQNTIDTAKENERGIVDIDTVKKVNEDLISTLEETVRIQEEGRAKRAAAEKELIAIEGRLKDALLRNSQRRAAGAQQ